MVVTYFYFQDLILFLLNKTQIFGENLLIQCPVKCVFGPTLILLYFEWQDITRNIKPHISTLIHEIIIYLSVFRNL